MSINYEKFTIKKEYEKDRFIDNFFNEINICYINEEILTNFLEKIFYTEKNSYRKKKVLEIICNLFFMEDIDISKHFILLLLLKISETDDPYVITTAIKYLFYFYEYDQEETIEKIKKFKHHENSDVSSEAYYRLGLIKISKLYSEEIKTDTNIFISNLFDARKYFDKSRNIMENSTKAEFYFLLTEYLYSLLVEDKHVDDIFNDLTNKLWERDIGYINKKYLKIDYQFYNIISNLKYIYNYVLRADNWFESFIEYFKRLSIHHYDIINLEIVENKFYKQYLNNFKDNITKSLLTPYYRNNLNSQKSRIDRILEEVDLSEDSELKEYLLYLRTVINQKEPPKYNKKKDKLLAKMAREFPDENIEILQKDIGDLDSLEEALNLCFKYVKRKNNYDGDYITGTLEGQEVYFRITDNLKMRLSNYDDVKLMVFCKMLEKIIQYTNQTLKGSRQIYPFLFEKDKGQNAVEEDLQESLYDYLYKSRMEYGLDYEKKQFADGGRVDIVFRNDKLTIPIELKKTKRKPTEEKIRKNYLGQVQTYTYPYNQLGIFMLLDLSDKAEAPPPNLNNLFNVEHLKPYYDIEDDKYPDYIVTIIVPGNKPLPSSRSKYE